MGEERALDVFCFGQESCQLFSVGLGVQFKIWEVNWRVLLADLLVSVSLSCEKNSMFFYRIKLG